MTGSEACSLPIESNKIVTTVKPTPLLFIGNDTVISPGQAVMLNPTIEGAVVSYQWEPPAYLDNPSIKNPVASPVVTTIYQLTVTGESGCTVSGKISVVVYYPLRMPNVFTPNADGKNDVFRIPPSTPQKIKSFSIFNRWGQMVFRTTNSSAGWDGSFKNQIQPVGTYVWMIDYEDLLTKKIVVASGTVVLIR
jgi:gliding motility-associated-like protein